MLYSKGMSVMHRSHSRTRRTGQQVAVSAGTLLLVKYILQEFGVNIPEDVLIVALGMLVTFAAKVQAFAETRGWLEDRRTIQ